ncbi:MAG: alpha/beta hydrolase [Candidatus Hydrogenedentes bacterium]|nr:alpha/beta hydrolase [Candidatus Hydrogenedentota bacterium]
MARRFFPALAAVAFLIAAAQPLIYGYQAQLVFNPGHAATPTPEDHGWTFEDVWLDVRWRETHAWYIRGENSRGVALYSHGNGGSIADCLEDIAVYRSLGFDLFVYDYGGYGLSTGQPSEYRCYADIRAAWKYLTESQGYTPDRIVLVGRSLGTGPACELSATVRPAAVVLESSFYSIAKSAEEEFPNNPLRYLLWHKFDNAAKVKDFSAPTLFVHGEEDDANPIEHAELLFDATAGPTQFLALRGGHNTAYLIERQRYVDALREFLDSAMNHE